jgi:predicted DNA-binding protein
MSYTIQRQVRLDQVTADALKALADERGETVSDVIRKAIEAEIIMSKYYNNQTVSDFVNKAIETIHDHRHYGATK